MGNGLFSRIKPKLAARVYYTLSPISPEFTSKLMYRRRFKRPLDLNDPKTLNEKIMWLKLNTYRNSELVTKCADKLRVREYVQEKGCGDILNELYGSWTSPDQIPWDELPESFVLKCNHGCGYNLFVSDKSQVDRKSVEKQLSVWLREDYWRNCAELQYRDIPKRIICEKYIRTDSTLYDYKIYCFNGEPKYILVCIGRERGTPGFYFFDSDWNFCRITRDGKRAPADFTVTKPDNLAEMLECARRLSNPFPFVRVDLYDADGRIIFGELTFTPSAALDTARLPETDVMFGEMLRLPERKRE